MEFSRMKSAFICLQIVIISTFSYGQLFQEELLVNWSGFITKKVNEKEIKIPTIVGQEYTGTRPMVSWSKKIAKNEVHSFHLLGISKSPATPEDLNYINFFKIPVPESFEYEFKCVNARTERYANLYFFPYMKENNVIYRIQKINFERKKSGMLLPNKANSFVANSVLADANSRWYKIAVTKDGIVKISKSWLEENGISVDMSPFSFHIYGNGEGKLSEYNGDKKVDDLVKNSIYFSGNNDQNWEDDEYFLFYAWGPNKWLKTGSSFTRDLNIYDNYSYYFIRISSSESPQLINEVVSTNSPIYTDVSTFNHYDIYETDLKNLVGGGQRWYGDLFDVELAKTIGFNIPNISSSQPVSFSASFASTNGGGLSNIQFSAAGTILNTTNLNSGSSDYIRQTVSFTHTTSTSALSLAINVNRHNPSVLTYLDKIEINARRNLVFNGNEMNFRDINSVGPGTFSKFTLSNVQASYFIWDITHRQQPKVIEPVFSNGNFEFIVATDSLREFVCSSGNSFGEAVFIRQLEPQNLHALSPAKLLIVTHPDFINEASRLAAVHENDGTSALVVTTEQVYNEFSGGGVDPTAIKWFAKMFYQRANGNTSLMPENLLLFGDGTYDPKNRVEGNNYFVPTYQVIASEDHLNAMVTDDYFGMLDDNEAIANSDMMDLGVGRMIISTTQQGNEMVDKIIQYLKKGVNNNTLVNGCSVDNSTCSSYGDWRLKYVQIADDEEGGYFIVQDTEPQYEITKIEAPGMNADKLYLDAFPQQASAGGDRYPDVYNAITEKMQNGALIINYVGHGGEVGVAEERVITVPQIQSWTNWCNLPLFVSATCEFTKYDDPVRVSAGEWMYLNPKGGAIALMTTTRSVFFGINTNMGKSFYRNVFDRATDNRGLTFGEIMRRTKNGVATDGNNKRSFNLIGDPALRIALPQYKIFTDSINGHSSTTYIDTMKALAKVTIKGHVADYSGNFLSNFNGVLYPTIFDKKKTLRTLAQDADSPEIEFEMQKNALFRGKATVKDGRFEFSFIVPKDINYTFDLGKISYYSSSETADASGFDTLFYIGGIDPNGIMDDTGPDIKLYLNSEKFINGGLINEDPVLIAEVEDDNGINMVGNGIGHDITAVLDNDQANPILLNNYFSSDLDSYQSGKINYQFNDLENGKHTLVLKVWDVNNNSSESKIDFEVQKSDFFQLSHVLNYPNPFTTNTSFYFEHNQLCSTLDVMIQIMTISGKLVKTIRQEVYNDCFRSDGIQWDGRDDFGDQLAKGVYIYRLRVKNTEGLVSEKLEKLVLLK